MHKHFRHFFCTIADWGCKETIFFPCPFIFLLSVIVKPFVLLKVLYKLIEIVVCAGDVEGGSGSGGAAEAGERFSDDWPGYGSFSPPRNTLPVDKPPRPRDRLRPQDMPTNKRNRLNGRSRSDAGRLSPALLSALLLTVCFSLGL